MNELIAGLLVIFVIFLVIREFWMWYWKINKRISLLEKNNELLERLINHNTLSSIKNAPETDLNNPEVLKNITAKLNNDPAPGGTIKCEICNTIIEVKRYTKPGIIIKCPNCAHRNKVG